MPCEPIGGPGFRGVVCRRGARRPAPCFYCPAPHTLLCDHTLYGRRQTCDRKLCASHRVADGPGRDLCPEHAIAEEKPICGVVPSGVTR